MSKQSDQVYLYLKEIFPQATVKSEYHVNFKGKRLFFDFYMSQYNIVVEVQGRQHYEFIKHFHGDWDGYNKSKLRDNLKIEYVDLNGLTLVIVDYNEKIDRIKLLNKIAEAQDD